MRLIEKCSICDKVLELLTEEKLSDAESLRHYKCGHSFVHNSNILTTEIPTESLTGKKSAYQYQVDGVKFIQDSSFNCLIADQMGLGKTIQALLALRSQYINKTPCLIIVKSATTWQWLKEYKEWCDSKPSGIWLIQGTKAWIPPGFSSYIISMDSFSRAGLVDTLLEFGFKLIIADEIHSFKNSESNRSQALVKFIQKISQKSSEREIDLKCALCKKEWTEKTTITVDSRRDQSSATNRHTTHCPQCGAYTSQVTQKVLNTPDNETEERVGVIFLSGTPIKNRADEYFIPLNILRPDQFPSLERFRRTWLEQDSKGKWAHVKEWRINSFKELIEPYVLRRERREVLKDLPPFRRDFIDVFIDNEDLKKAYNRELDKIQVIDSEKEAKYSDIQANIMTMRRIIGMAKVKFAANYIKVFLEESEDDKIMIGIHHHIVRDSLEMELKDYSPIVISGEDSAESKYRKVQRLRESQHSNRVAIISSLAGGTGIDGLQTCISNGLVIERQWNAADEEQFEDRINQRIGQTKPVIFEYLVAKGTIDNWFSDMVETKREIFGETIGNNWNVQDDNSTREMIDYALSNRL